MILRWDPTSRPVSVLVLEGGGRLESITDPVGMVTTLAYDDRGLPTTAEISFTPLALGSSEIVVTVDDAGAIDAAAAVLALVWMLGGSR